jgi:hypothetical protein
VIPQSKIMLHHAETISRFGLSVLVDVTDKCCVAGGRATRSSTVYHQVDPSSADEQTIKVAVRAATDK